eukprot:6257790-Prymnesium_polylepis.1
MSSSMLPAMPAAIPPHVFTYWQSDAEAAMPEVVAASLALMAHETSRAGFTLRILNDSSPE